MTIDGALERRFIAVDHPGWRQGHASTLLVVDGGALVAWFGGTREGAPDNRIWSSSRPTADAPWGEAVVLAEGAVAHWNPVLAHGPDGAIWLFYKRGERISQWATWVRRSWDGGRTWSGPEQLVPDDVGGRGPVKNPPLLMPDGGWLAPASRERWGEQTVWEPFVDVSTDDGRTWHAQAIPVDRTRLRGTGLIQPALWFDGDAVFALMRSTEGRAYLSTSGDAGRTWSVAEPVELPNNNSGLTALALPDGTVACVHNPVSADWGARCPLVVSVSEDNGRTWTRSVVVEDGRTPIEGDRSRAPQLPPSGAFAAADDGVQTTGVGEYSYPSAALDGDHLLIAYTWQRRGIVEARVPLNLLSTRKDSVPL